MEIQLQELIDKIKRDGIESASAEAARIKQDAEGEARAIVEAAKKEAADMVARTKVDVERMDKAGIAALEQASRNLVLAFKDEIQVLLDKITSNSVSGAYGEDVLKAVLPEVLKVWGAKSDAVAFDVALSEQDLGKLQNWFNVSLAAELKKGAELKSNKSLSAGFRIVNKDGSAYYDFSAEAVASMLSSYLSPKLAKIINDSVKGN